MKTKETAFIVAQALIVIAVIALVALPLESLDREPYQVVRDNVTLTGNMASQISCAFIMSCPIPYDQVYALHGVELIIYKGVYYYVHNHTHDVSVEKPANGTAGPYATTWVVTNSGGVATTYTFTESQEPVVHLTAWFTNSTIYCASPEGGWGVDAPVCPS